MFKIDVGYMHQNVKAIGRNCGFNYSDLGPTHYGLEDIALVRLIPDVAVLAPADASQLRGALRAMVRYDGPVYLRISTAPIPKLFDEADFEIGKGIVVREGKDVAIIVTGEVCKNVLEAADQLEKSGVSAKVVVLPTIVPWTKRSFGKLRRKPEKSLRLRSTMSSEGCTPPSARSAPGRRRFRLRPSAFRTCI
jgi:transketolase